MKKILSFVAFIVTAHCCTAQSATWVDDPMHSKLTFTVTHQGFNSVLGLFQKFEAKVTAEKPDFSDAVFTLSVDASSVNTEVKMRDDDLRSAHFFEVSKYPEITFRSTSIFNTTGMKDRFKMTGDLTMHGVTKTVTMDIWYRGTIVDPKSKKTKSGFQLTGIINRNDFNIGQPDPFDISTDIMIKADGEFIKQ